MREAGLEWISGRDAIGSTPCLPSRPPRTRPDVPRGDALLEGLGLWLGVRRGGSEVTLPSTLLERSGMVMTGLLDPVP